MTVQTLQDWKPGPRPAPVSPDEAAQSFRDIVREVINTSNAMHPNDLSAEVLDKLSPGEVYAGLTITLPDYVRSALGAIARDTRVVRQVDRVNPDPHKQARRIRDDWRATLLAARMNNGDEVKPFGEFTADDCRAAAQIRMDLAKANEHEANRYLAVAKRIEESGGDTVADVDTDTLKFAWSDGAL